MNSKRRTVCGLGIVLGYAALLLMVSGCSAHYPENPSLDSRIDNGGYHTGNPTLGPLNSEEILLLLAFSGGGTRAAAFSYGVLKELSQASLMLHNKTLNLADEVDVISSVSGGSFTAAYFGLFGDRIFEDFETKFLRRDLQGELTNRILFSPSRWTDMASDFYGRSDLATELYDETIFDGATFADLATAKGPMIIINATEMTLGTRFQFTQTYFDIICSDLSQLPVARAVTASSAVPVLFSPVSLTNRAGSCGWQSPEWMQKAMAQPERTNRLYNLAANMNSLNNRKGRPYLHLLDGGLADNLGLRSILDAVLRYDNFSEAIKELGLEQTRKVIVLLVNAETVLDIESSRLQRIPTFASVLNAATSVPLQRYSFETVALLQSRLQEWERQSLEDECGESRDEKCRGVSLDFIEVNFSEHPDPEERMYLKTLPTTFALDDEAVNRLIDAGGLILRNNSVFQKISIE